MTAQANLEHRFIGRGTQMGLSVLAEQADQPADGNPYITSLYDAMRAQGLTVTPLSRRGLLERHDIVHVHWPEQIVRWDAAPFTVVLDIVKVLFGLSVAKARGARLVWTGHDLGPHDMPRPRLYRAYISAFGRLVDLVVSLSEAATDHLTRSYPWLARKEIVVIPHGHYQDAYAPPPERNEGREQLSLPTDVPIYLLLGQIRRYKNTTGLVEAFGPLGDRGHLVIAGKVIGDELLEDELMRAASAAGNVTLRLGRVASADVPLFHAAADVVVLPYSEGTALHSGAALLALSMARPVVVRDSATMRELQALVGPEWIRTFSGDVKDALDAAAELAALPRSGGPDLSSLDWDRIGKATAEAFAQVSAAS